ncbi:SGNH/GDSL hydrolase family protein [Massilia sp. CFBP9012]|uniref:SGNH/GDSL hydrolase family protein n=1 Tax=Massilia sp. CFBP9012 TaxID=3096531 RepID=UPI002A6B50A3|nr:SGNH/GDSL hydrolase family protein [Massilia sp. CFBP9012]MDY0977372.1 SGNH/GDSL hydrolase family protein [Massilia sp. CFBP9012]
MNRFLSALAAAARWLLPQLSFSSHHVTPALRRLLLASAMLAAAITLVGQPAVAQAWDNSHWTANWGAAPAGPPPDASLYAFNNQTLRLIVQSSVGGNRVRIRLSNELGSTPLRIGAARIGLRAQGSDLAPGTDRALTFGGRAGVTIPAGAPALSDPVELNLPPLASVAVSLYLPGAVPAATVHVQARQTGYVSPSGDHTASASLPVQRTITAWPFLTALEVDGVNGAIVVLGDALTDGTRSTMDANRRWTDVLVRRLQTGRDAAARPAVINRGIASNRLLGDDPAKPLAGRSALARFERDVLATSGVRQLVLMIGIEDIGHSSAANPVTLDDLVAGYRQLIARARAARIAVIGGTLAPFEGAALHSDEKETLRQAVNAWIRSSGEFDAVFDADRVLRDPARPSRLLPAYDSGYHLHPNDRGYQALGEAMPLTLPRR